MPGASDFFAYVKVLISLQEGEFTCRSDESSCWSSPPAGGPGGPGRRSVPDHGHLQDAGPRPRPHRVHRQGGSPSARPLQDDPRGQGRSGRSVQRHDRLPAAARRPPSASTSSAIPTAPSGPRSPSTSPSGTSTSTATPPAYEGIPPAPARRRPRLLDHGHLGHGLAGGRHHLHPLADRDPPSRHQNRHRRRLARRHPRPRGGQRPSERLGRHHPLGGDARTARTRRCARSTRATAPRSRPSSPPGWSTTASGPTSSRWPTSCRERPRRADPDPALPAQPDQPSDAGGDRQRRPPRARRPCRLPTTC